MTNENSNKSEKRTSAFKRNLDLESLLRDINSNLWIAEQNVIKNYTTPELPIIFIMGAMRSGTTLFMQWLANTQMVSYPTNLLSRFYNSPVLGSKIQLMLTDERYNFRNELGEFNQNSSYTSENGKTTGVLAPNEFWYFWRRFLINPDRDDHSNIDLEASMDTKLLLAELAGIVDTFKKPFACKGMLFNYNIEFLSSLIDNALFIHLKRDPVYNMQSVLSAREKQLGSRNNWYSFKIREYPDLSTLDPVKQVAGQIFYINKAISQGQSQLHENNKLEVSYEDFCNNPKAVYELIALKLENLGYKSIKKYSGEDSFKPNLKWKGSQSDKQAYMDAYNSFD